MRRNTIDDEGEPLDGSLPSFQKIKRRTRWGHGRSSSQCGGKVKYKAQAIAKFAARRIDGLVHYRCRYCNQWHVGNTPLHKE